MVDEMLLEHEAPLLDGVEQSTLEGAGIQSHPAVDQVHSLQLQHLAIDALVCVYLLPETAQRRGGLWHAVLGVRLDLLASEHVAVKQELTQELLAVVHVQVGEALVVVAQLAAASRHRLHALSEELTHVCQVGHVLHVCLWRQSERDRQRETDRERGKKRERGERERQYYFKALNDMLDDTWHAIRNSMITETMLWLLNRHKQRWVLVMCN